MQSVALSRARARALSLPRSLPLSHMHTFAHLTVKGFHSLLCNTLQHTATHCNTLQHNAATQSATPLTHAHVRAPNRQGFPLVNSTPLAIENLLDFLTNFDVFIAPSPFAAVAPSLQHLHARIPLWMPGKKAPNARIKCVRLMNEGLYTHKWTTSSIHV